jgi:hypothetical protein
MPAAMFARSHDQPLMPETVMVDVVGGRYAARVLIRPISDEEGMRLPRIVHDMLARAVLAAQVGRVVQPVRSRGAE